MTSGEGRRIVLVDDVPANRYVVATWLRRAGYDVVEAGTGRAALELVNPETDVVVLDVNLPDISGFEVCRLIKADEATSWVPVMHVSATAVDAASRTSGLAGGADAYLIEPVDRDEFLATVQSLWRAQDARRSAAASARRMGAIAAAAVPISEARTFDALIRAAATAVAEVLRRPSLIVTVAADGSTRRVLCPGPGREHVLGDEAPPIWSGWPLAGATVVRAGATPPTWQLMLDMSGLGDRSWHAFAMTRAGQILGGMAVALGDGEADLPPEDRAAMDQLGDTVAVALANLRSFAEEHGIALTLQRALLPDALPVLEGWRFAARYSASNHELSIGGDFYDVFLVPDGRVATVIGDVQGHSLRAATVMGELRFSLRAYLGEGHDASTALDLLNHLLIARHPEFVTLCVVMIDPVAGALEVVNAGHLPPVLRTPEGSRALAGAHPLLGVRSDRPFEVGRHEMPAGSALVLVTDGLVERRGGDLQEALRRLTAAVGEASTRDPEVLCDVLLDMFDAGTAEDDVAVLVVERDVGLRSS